MYGTAQARLSAAVLPFRRAVASDAPAETNPAAATRGPPADNRFSVADRIALLRWVETASAIGIRRVVLEQPDPDDDHAVVGDFALIYRDDAQWAGWGVARTDGFYEVWRPGTGRSLGRFASLDEALALIGMQP